MNLQDFADPESIRAAIKRELDTLPEGKMLTTTELVKWLMEKNGADRDTKFLAKVIFDRLGRKPLEVFPGYTTAGEPKISTGGFTKGKTITPILWHRPHPICPHCAGTGRQEARP